MNTKLSIKNFRVFDENGVSIDIKPMTILTGCNSSGKSSIARSILLLNSFLTQIKKDIENGDPITLDQYKIDFTTYPNNQLGRFDRVLHKGSSSRRITVAYSVYSLMLSKDVNVELVFEADENDDLNNAFLHSITLEINGEVFYSSSKENGRKCNLNIIKDACLEFLPIEFITHNYCGLEGLYDLERAISKDEYENSRDNMMLYLRDCEKQRRNDVFRYVRTARVEDSILSRCKVDPEVLQWTLENNSFFMIPIIDRLDTLNKEEFESVVLNNFIQDESESKIRASKKVISDFLKSEFNTFGEYFRHFEDEYLNDIRVISFSIGKDPCFPNPDALRVNQKYIITDMLNISAEYVDLAGDGKLPDKNQEIKSWRDQSLSFGIVYEIVMLWNKSFKAEESIYYKGFKSEMGNFHYTHSMYTLLTTFACDLMKEVVCPDWCGNVAYVSSTRAMIKGLYTLDSSDDFSQLIKRYFDKKRLFFDYQKSRKSPERKYEIDSFMNRWIQKFGIGDHLRLMFDADGLGAYLRLYKNNDSKGRLLEDEGYGITQLISILLQIETAILAAKGEKVNRFWGLEQLDHYNDSVFHYEINTIVVEEPEIHLHPSYQSMLAEMFVEASSKYNIHFIIETHSEYLIRKLQTLVAKNIITSESISILYINSELEKRPLYTPQIVSIRVKEDGRLTDNFGPGFFDEADKTTVELLTLKGGNI